MRLVLYALFGILHAQEDNRMAKFKPKKQVMHFENSERLCEHVATISDSSVLVSFSGGKDSICTMLQCQKFFKHVTPVYMYGIPDLEFINRGLDYFEQFFGVKIWRMPSPSLYTQLRNLIFQPPEHCAVIEEANLIEFDYDFLFDAMVDILGISQQTYVAIGVRASDSLNRWSAIQQYGAVNMDRKSFFPIYDWKKDRIIETIRSSGVKLPDEYRHFGRSYDGLDWRFLHKIKEFYPEDYQRILEWFPLAELELKRIEYRKRHYDALAKGGDV
jgi:hypothetical protein